MFDDELVPPLELSETEPAEIVTAQVGTLLVLLSSIILQIGFIGVVVNYDFRNRRLKDREIAEAAERSRGLNE